MTSAATRRTGSQYTASRPRRIRAPTSEPTTDRTPTNSVREPPPAANAGHCQIRRRVAVLGGRRTRDAGVQRRPTLTKAQRRNGGAHRPRTSYGAAPCTSEGRYSVRGGECLASRAADHRNGPPASVRRLPLAARPAPASVNRQQRRADCWYPCNSTLRRPRAAPTGHLLPSPVRSTRAARQRVSLRAISRCSRGADGV
jgi:hypothetical protein